MCGIAGIIGNIDRAFAQCTVKNMVSTLARRGPDDEGIETWDTAVLGHRRLAIFDLSEAGHQPMVSANRTLGVVFNGAIYNYRDLRNELIASGYHFRTRTDTEVLLHGYQQWGLDRLVSRLQGMFAFGLWDAQLRKLYLVRDRLGVKPLAVFVNGKTLAFASTVRALRRVGYLEDLDENAVAEFLKFGFVSDERSIYRGAVKLPAASILEWSDGVLRSREYWRPPAAGKSPHLSFHEVVEETERLFLRAVQARLHADVPVGALLSGGIDSSLVCWATAKLGSQVTAYTIGTPGDPWDETADACATARKLGIPHCVLEMDDTATPDMQELVSAYAEPFACASALGMLKVSKAVAPSAKVLLTGDGGDDVFLGYPRHRHLWLAKKLSRMFPPYLKRAWLRYGSALPRIGMTRRVASLLDYTAGGLPAYIRNSNRSSMFQVNGILGDRLSSICHNNPPVFCSSSTDGQILDDFLEYERKTYFLGEYMPKVDGASMHFGLEARSPFLDHVLWEFASSLPFDIRLHQGRLKAILCALARKHIGVEVASRQKRGFGIPVHRWIVNRWRPIVEATLRDSILEREGWIHMDPVVAQMKLAVEKGSASHELWHLFVLESWLRYERCRASAN